MWAIDMLLYTYILTHIYIDTSDIFHVVIYCCRHAEDAAARRTPRSSLYTHMRYYYFRRAGDVADIHITTATGMLGMRLPEDHLDPDDDLD